MRSEGVDPVQIGGDVITNGADPHRKRQEQAPEQPVPRHTYGTPAGQQL